MDIVGRIKAELCVKFPERPKEINMCSFGLEATLSPGWQDSLRSLI